MHSKKIEQLKKDKEEREREIMEKGKRAKVNHHLDDELEKLQAQKKLEYRFRQWNSGMSGSLVYQLSGQIDDIENDHLAISIVKTLQDMERKDIIKEFHNYGLEVSLP